MRFSHTFLAVLLFGACTSAQPSIDEMYHSSVDASTSIRIAWRTEKLKSTPEGHVELSLLLSGAMEKDVDVGTVPGDRLTDIYDGQSDALLEREWWAGTDAAYYVRRKDATHLTIERELLDDFTENETLATIEVPAGKFVECVDNEEGCP